MAMETPPPGPSPPSSWSALASSCRSRSRSASSAAAPPWRAHSSSTWSATLNGSAAGVSIVGSVLTADYSALNGALPPGGQIVLRFRARINPALPIGTRLTNTARVSWNNTQTASATVSIDVGGMVGVGALSGTAWHDANFDKIADAGERVLEGWTVELYRNDRPIFSTVTDGDGLYRIIGVAPNDATADRYELRFRAPGAGANTAMLGYADSPYTNGLQRIRDITVEAGSIRQGLNLPIAPNGVVYNTIARTPVAGATLTLTRAGAPLPASCFDDPGQQNQLTMVGGYYRFDTNFSDPACPDGGGYVVDVTAPPTGYIAGASQIIPPTTGASTAPFPVPTCSGGADDAITATAEHCESQTSEFAPPPSARARSAGTRYHLHLTLNGSRIPGTSQVFNNHIPLDPDLRGAIAITKTTPTLNVSRGQLVPYTITITNITSVPLFEVSVVDRFPTGFRYVEGSARIDGVATEPAVAGRELVWNDLAVDGSARHRIVLLLAVGAGVSEGEFVNRAQSVQMLSGTALSGEASATVRVIPDPTFDCTDVIGKVYDDANRNGSQDAGEPGLPGVRLVSARGLTSTTDANGRFHVTCAITPREGRGSNFVLKLDDRTLPSGYRSSTEQLRVGRATRGKALRMNFAASLHRVVGLDLADAVFEPGTTEMRLQWKPRVELLLSELRKAPAVLRLSYLADLEEERLVEQRLDVIRQEIMRGWTALDGTYPLTIEPKVFWRLGAPPKQHAVRTRAGR
jgi:large repetitive protein